MNNGYGGPAPRLDGSVIVSLRNMDKVLEIDEELAYCVVEPGVRWFDLYDAIKAGGHKLMVSIPDLGWGGVVSNFLENGATYLPQAQDMAAYCGMEVVLANGEVLRTGMGAMPDNRSWHVYKRSLGPTLDQLFMQSNFGIVTKLGVWLMPWPECYMPLWLRAWKDDDLGPIVDTLRGLMLDRTIENVPQIWNSVAMASVISNRAPWYEGEDPMPDDAIDHMAKELDIGRWLMRFALYGDEAVVDHRFAKVKAAFEAIPGVEVWGSKCAPEDMEQLEHPFDRVQAGVPNLDINQMTGWYGGEEGGHIGFSPVGRLTGKDAVEMRDVIRGLVQKEAKLDYAAVLIPTNSRSFIHVTMVIFDTKDESQTRRAYDTSKLLVREAAQVRLRRVPRPSRLHGPGAGAVLVQRPRLPAFRRDDQGRGRPERDPLARQAGVLAGIDAERALAMGFEQYHEPAGELSAETRTFARMIASLTEEAEAIGWYEQRISLEPDPEARAIMANAQLEEFKHFGMDLEFLLRRTPNWRTALQAILFTDGDIVESGEQAEHELDLE